MFGWTNAEGHSARRWAPVWICLLAGAPALASPIPNGDFASGDLTGWESVGFASVVGPSYGTTAPQSGDHMALIENGRQAILGEPDETSETGVSEEELETFLGLDAGSLEALVPLLIEGAAIRRTLQVNAGDRLTVGWNFLTDEDFANDFAFISITAGPGATLLAEVFPPSVSPDFNPDLSTSATRYLLETRWQTYEYTFTESGLVTLGLGVVDGGNTDFDYVDTLTDSALMISHIDVPEPTMLVLLSPIALALLRRPNRRGGSAGGLPAA